ncbi:MAG: response regulator transcription factor [Flavobacteriales bacterium]|nr:response regulator transcription factor [Flavobacteriales bacterium]HRH68368.1 response regulator [Flavobacteriales bacterium]
MRHVVLVEDDALVRKLLEKRLVSAGWQVTAMRDGRGLSEFLRVAKADILLVDLGLPHIDGLALVEDLRAQGIDTPVMVLTAYDLPHLHATVRSTGADELVQKPYDPEELLLRMARLLAA